MYMFIFFYNWVNNFIFILIQLKLNVIFIWLFKIYCFYVLNQGNILFVDIFNVCYVNVSCDVLLFYMFMNGDIYIIKGNLFMGIFLGEFFMIFNY